MFKRTLIEELKAGMYVCGFERPGGEPISFMNNILVKDSRDIDRYRSLGYLAAYVVETGRNDFTSTRLPKAPAPGGHGAPPPTPAAGPAHERQGRAGEGGEERREDRADEVPQTRGEETKRAATARAADPEGAGDDPVEFLREIDAALEIRNEAEVLVREFMTDVRMGRSLDAGRVHDAVENMIDSLYRNRDAITSLTRLKTHDEYTFGHSLNVSLLSISIGRHMGFDRPSLISLGVGAILHDVGKVLVPERLLRKTSALTNDEYDLMKRHVELGYEYIVRAKGIRRDSLFVTLQHHERYNGSGYPMRAAGPRIHLYARIAAVADVYDAMTSTRTYQDKMLADDALRKMYLMKEAHFAPGMVERLVKCLGIYPIGTYVRLSTREVAVVTAANRSNPLKPRVRIVLDREGRAPARGEEIDLAADGDRWVLASVDPVDFGIKDG